MTRTVGMAKPRASAEPSSVTILMVVTPTTWPYWLIRAPPELPKLMAALVWMSTMVVPSTSTSRSRAEMMPSVMVDR